MSMHIDAYDFGRISVGGKQYSSDVIIRPDGVLDKWWRQEGHRLDIADLTEVLNGNPQILIVGTGFYGRMQVPQATLEQLQQHGIRVESFKTQQAVQEFNRLQQGCDNIVAALHLTC